MSGKKGVLRGATRANAITHAGGVGRFRSRHSIAISILEGRMDHEPDTRGDDVAKVSRGPLPEVSRAICLARYTYTLRLRESCQDE